MIDLKGLNGVEIDRVKKAYQQGKIDRNEDVSEAYDIGYEQGRADAIKSVFAKIGQPNECLFNYQSACCYPISDCMNCPITIDEMKGAE